MSDTTYNGWTNYATWRVNLELCDDYAQSLIDDREHFDSTGKLADRLKEYVDEALTNFGETTTGLALDYANAFVSDVNWYEIAGHYTDDLVTTEEEAEES